MRYGNLLTLPVGGGLLYVEPVYVQAEAATSFPLLRKVLVSFGNEVAFEDTLEEALDALFADQGGNPAGDAAPRSRPPTEPPPDAPTEPAATPVSRATSQAALADAQNAIEAAEAAADGRRLRGVRHRPRRTCSGRSSGPARRRQAAAVGRAGSVGDARRASPSADWRARFGGRWRR